MSSNYKGKEPVPGKKFILGCIFAISIILVVGVIIFVRSYMSHASRWNSKSSTASDATYTSHSILSQNVSASANTINTTEFADLFTNMMDVHTPDIICLQDVSSTIINELATYTSGNRYDVVIKYTDSANLSSTPIFYNTKKYTLENSGYFWLSDTPNLSSCAWTDIKPYIATWAILKDKTTQETFGILNTELSKDIDVQSKSLKCIFSNCNTIFQDIEYTLCGTFNCTTKDNSFSIIDNKYTNLSVIANKLYNVGPTTTNNTEIQTDDYVYDYFFGSSKIKCDRYAVLKESVTTTNGLSHYGVMSNIYLESADKSSN